jgi:alpha,alpha-trehalose phosphorylase
MFGRILVAIAGDTLTAHVLGVAAALAGFGGLRDYGDTLSFAPRPPAPLTRLRFRLLYRGRQLRIKIGHDQARYEPRAGEPLALLHHGEPLTLAASAPQVRPCPYTPELPPVAPPPGRAACRHGVGADAGKAGMTAPLPRR